MADGEIVLTRDRSSGRVHKRVRVGALGIGLASFEADNLELDEAGLYDEIPSLDGVNPDDLCHRCFPVAERKG